MRKIIFIFFIAFASCKHPKLDDAFSPMAQPIENKKCDSLEKKYDSLLIVAKHGIDSILQSNKLLRGNLNATYDSNKVYRATQVELNRFMEVCIKDPSQLVFLRGWYKRAERIK